MNRLRIGLIALPLLVVGCTSAEQERTYRDFFYETAQPLVPGFRLPDESQYGPAWAAVEGRNWQTRDGSGQTKAEFWTNGEFNGDGKIDFAYILVEVATDDRTLLAFVSTPDGYEVQRLDQGFEWGIWLKTRPPGRYSTVPTQSANQGSEFELAAFEAKNQAIDFFPSEGDTSSFVWNATTQSFDRFWTRD